MRGDGMSMHILRQRSRQAGQGGLSAVFSTPAQSFLDFYRLVVFGLSLAYAGLAIWGARDQKAKELPTYPWLTISTSLFVLLAGFAELQRLGDAFTWHLVPKTVAFVAAFIAMYRMGVYRSAPRQDW